MNAITLNNRTFNNAIEALEYAISVADSVKALRFDTDNFLMSNERGCCHVWFHVRVLDKLVRLAVETEGISILCWLDKKGWQKLSATETRLYLKDVE